AARRRVQAGGSAMKRPLIAVSVGCPSGVGPEVAVAGAARVPSARCVLVGDEAVIRSAARLRGIAGRRLVVVDGARAMKALAPGQIGVFAGSSRLAGAAAPGSPDAAAGRAQL